MDKIAGRAKKMANKTKKAVKTKKKAISAGRASNTKKKEIKRLYRSREDRVIRGVCGGIANYFEIDPVLVRLLWVIFSMVYGSGLMAYLICWLIIPEEPEENLGRNS